MTAILLALTASIGYGTADFFAGLASRRLPPVLVVLYVQMVQMVLVLAIALMTQQPFTTLGAVWGVAAGAMNAIALILYYQALSNSPASIIAPIVASSSAVPVGLSVLRGVVPSTLTMTGLLAVFVGVIITTMASGNEADRHQEIDVPPPCRGFIFRNWQPRYFRRIPSTCILFAIASSLMFGLFFIIFEQGSASSPAGRVWVTFGVQAGTIPITLLSAIFIQKVKRFAPAKAFSMSTVWSVILLNLIADVALTYALGFNALGIVSVLASAGAVVTALLAQIFARERLSPAQAIGTSLTVLGTLLVAYTS